MQYVCRTAILPKLQKLCFCTLLLYVKQIFFYLMDCLKIVDNIIQKQYSENFKTFILFTFDFIFLMKTIARFWKLEIVFSWKARTFSACN